MTAIEAELARLRLLHERATPGPWTHDPHVPGHVTEPTAKCVTCSPEHHNATLIAAARNALPALIREVELLRAHVVKWGPEHIRPDCPCESCALLRPDRKLGSP